ncbi:hypothetical protein [Poseidonibacter lekithochrous]|uniref:hypothetical protein n=1 Tax=Poseidonibacter lekithochrous TaxID=1904463 RepID=UPI0008FC712B|nr:hypothetical protein [Poseidonibacter lekithochrous]QKJ23612.1 hypothetical protein ALEK_2357 [Poseidonibacter lekithochrous]
MKNLNEDVIFEKMNPLIKDSMTNEQKRETKKLISCALPKATKKIVNLNFDFWFFKMFYITIYLGSEKRKMERKFTLTKLSHILFIMFSTFLVFLVIASVLTAIFLALYYIKSLIGIDLFQFHLLR